jgi:phage I-like protein
MELPAAAGGQGVPQWVHLLPLGTFEGRDGRGPFVIRDAAHAAQVITATKKHLGGADMAGDFDHQLLYSAQNGKPAPASGWIKDFEVRDDGIWGRVEWTARASEAIAGKEYRYLSPVFGHAADGTVMRLRAFGLTNVPNLELTAIASQSLSETDEDTMKLSAVLTTLIAALGLPDTTTEEQLSAHCQKLDTDLKTAKASTATIAKALGQADTATGEVIVAAAQELTKKAAGTADPDPAKFVPIAMFNELNTRVAAMSQSLVTDKATKAIDDAKAAGKLAPAQMDWAQSYAAKDLDGFIAWCSNAPVIVAPTGNGGERQALPALANANGLTGEEVAICKQMGITEAAFLETKKKSAA